MPKISFIFIAAAFLTLPLEEIQSGLFDRLEALFCIALIASFGIAHGAVDHHLYGFRNLKQNLVFIGWYLLAAVAYGILWFWQADLAFLIFMLISAYHFGQSQFVESLRARPILDKLLYTFWGATLLAAFLYFNQTELQGNSAAELAQLDSLGWLLDQAAVLFTVSLIALSLLLLLSLYLGDLSGSNAAIELYQLALIIGVFYLASPLWGFTLYFVILHSGRVLQQEFRFLQSTQKIKGLSNFIKVLSPFTLLSLFGLGLIIGIFYYFRIDYSWSLLALIFISCLTFPHSWVMDRFYRRAKV